MNPAAGPEALRRVTGAIRACGAAAQVCLLSDGEVVLDEAFGCRRDDLFLIFSTGKPFVALLARAGKDAVPDPAGAPASLRHPGRPEPVA